MSNDELNSCKNRENI